VNFNHTKHPEGNGALIGCNPFLHQLVFVADGRGDLLLRTTGTHLGGPYEVSHLCHTPGCFNPGHLIIEPRALNEARNACKTARPIEVGGVRIHPCVHWDDGQWYDGEKGPQRRCILGEAVVIGEEARGRNVDARVAGGFVIR